MAGSWLDMLAGRPSGGAPGQVPLGQERKKLNLEPSYYGEPVPEQEDPALNEGNDLRMAVISQMLGQPFPNDSLQDRMMPPRTFSPQPNGEIPDTRGWNSDQKYNNPMTFDENVRHYTGKIPGMVPLVGTMNGLAKNATGTGEGEQIASGIRQMRDIQGDLERKKNIPFTISGRRPRQ